MRIALYPGNFDPITYGHLDIIRRASHLFDRVVVAPVETGSRGELAFSLPDRIALIEQSLQVVSQLDLSRIVVQGFSGLSVAFARSVGAKAIIRGLRLVSDFEYELQFAQNNKWLAPEVETCCIITSQEYSSLSSQMVKEIARQGGQIQQLAPAPVVDRLYQFYNSYQ